AEDIMSSVATGSLTKLRLDYRDLEAKASELEASVGPGHFQVVKLRARMDEMRKSIREEERRVTESYANEYNIAKVRESELASSMAQLLAEAGTSSQAQVKMRELESSADTLRTLYNSFLQKFKEINTAQAETIPVQNARVLTRASPPSKNSKKAAAVLAGSIVVGLLLGLGAAIGKGVATVVFRSRE